jgi:hemoglobin/transferrin/lactoferrin receptor protein
VLIAALLATTAVATGLTITTEAVAQAQTSFNIPAGPLNRALAAFGRQSGTQISYDAAIANGKISPGLQGPATREQALSRILQGSRLVYSFSDGRNVLITQAGSSTAGSGSVPADGSLLLNPIEVSGKGDRNAHSGSGYQGTPDWVYETPAAVSVVSRQAIENNPSRNTRDLLDNVAGVYVSRAEAQQPGISVNIRGLQDQDRIGMLIDGARQDFQRNGHGATQQTYVDTAFLRQIDVEKSSTSGVNSLGTLGGYVNFRTLNADDLIKPGNKFGGQANAGTGTNGFWWDGSAVAAARLSDSFSILAGISNKNIGPYEVGKNGELQKLTTYTGNTLLFSGQTVTAGILKAEAKLNDYAKLTLSWMRNNSSFNTGYYDSLVLNGGLRQTTQTVLNDTYNVAFDWKPDGNWIDLHARLYYNHVDNSDNSIVHDGEPIRYTMGTLGGSLENTSRFDTKLGALSLNYGGMALQDDGKTQMPGQFFDASTGANITDSLSGGMPSGKRTEAGGFVNAKLEHDNWLTVQGGVRYDWYHLWGNTSIYGDRTRDLIDTIFHPGTPPVCLPSPPFPPGLCNGGTPPSTEYVYGPDYFPRYDVNVDRSDGAFLPTFMVAVQPFDWLQPFVKYSRSFRPPTIMESLLNSVHSNEINTYAPNPDLGPERGDTYELGFNISKNGVFKDDDKLRLKVVGFYREIENYIALGQSYNADVDKRYISFVNLLGTTRMRGLELEANYDARIWYLGGTLTLNHAEFPETAAVGGGFPAGEVDPFNSVLFVQPERRIALDGGIRLFEQKLTLGARMTKVSETNPTIGTLQNNYKLDGYTIYDLYGSYAFTDDIKLRVNVNNLTDVAYISALGADYYAMPGRTITASLNFKF